MERIQFNHGRIIWCCQDAKISLGELAAETGVSEATLEKVVLGEKGLTYPQLTKIASFFGRGILFFMDAGPVEESNVHSAAFRSIANQKPNISSKLRSLVERTEKQRDIYLSLKEEISSEQAEFENINFSSDVSKAAQQARKWLGLAGQNTFAQYRAAIEQKGILVFRSNGYHGQWQIAKDNPVTGFSIYHEKCPVIFVKKQFEETFQTFTLIHELGHILLHRSSSIDDQDDMSSHSGHERDANKFAGLVLVPDSYLDGVNLLMKPFDAYDFDAWLAPQRRAWGVSTEVILRRLLDSNMLSREEYASYRAWRASLKHEEKKGGGSRYRYKEPRNIFGDKFVKVILDSLFAKNITITKASSYLDGIKVKDIHSLKGHYVGA